MAEENEAGVSESVVELVKYVVKSLVDNPDSMSIELGKEEDVDVINIKVEESDRGKIIGRQGRIAKAIRVLARALAIKEGNRRLLVKIVD